MRNIKARTLWIITAILFLIAIGLIFATQYSNGALNKFCLISLIATFVIITILIQFATLKSFNGRKNIKYKVEEYKTNLVDIEEKLISIGYKKTKRNFGNSYLLIRDKKAYKISFIDNSENYFNYDEKDDKSKPNKELDACKTFTGIEIFNQIDEKNVNKLVEFSIQTNNLYYTALVKLENGNYKCMNYEKPNENHEESVNNIFNDLEMIKIKENEKEEH